MNNSSPLIRIVNVNGIHPIHKAVAVARLNNTVNTVCPAVILANNRTESEIGRASWLMISIVIIIGIKSLGIPGGTSIPKKCNPCLAKPMTRVRIKIPPANAPVTAS